MALHATITIPAVSAAIIHNTSAPIRFNVVNTGSSAASGTLQWKLVTGSTNAATGSVGVGSVAAHGSKTVNTTITIPASSITYTFAQNGGSVSFSSITILYTAISTVSAGTKINAILYSNLAGYIKNVSNYFNKGATQPTAPSGGTAVSASNLNTFFTALNTIYGSHGISVPTKGGVAYAATYNSIIAKIKTNPSSF